MVRSQLTNKEIEKIDTEYKSVREVRVAIAPPTCLWGDDECKHAECSNHKSIAEFIKTHLSMNKGKMSAVDLCLQACDAAASLSGNEIL